MTQQTRDTKDQKRRAVILAELSRMSKDWTKYKSYDWQPLERELSEIEERMLSKAIKDHGG